MTTLLQHTQIAANNAISHLYGTHITNLQVQDTRPELAGNYTVVLFALVKQLGKPPVIIGNELGTYLVQQHPGIYNNYEVVNGFLNLTVHTQYLLTVLYNHYNDVCYAKLPLNGLKVMVEYSSPNTNKPLHLGHLRNNFLGYSIAKIYEANGYDVVTSCIVNDRGIHICKSMIAWQLFAEGATPHSTGTKGDHFVGKYYVLFNNEYKRQIAALIASGVAEKEAEKEAPIMKATQIMLLQWEQGNTQVMELWRTMNSWVYAGFENTYKTIGTTFTKTYYESNTYLLGKDAVQLGLAKKVFYQKPDGSIWIDLTANGLDEKLVMRADGTSVYITQDIGLAQQKYEEYGIDKSIYVVGNEQDYHLAVLKLICQKLQLPYANQIVHLSYGMVELPDGKMKSREGTVVDADDLIAEMTEKSSLATAKHGKPEGLTSEQLRELYSTIALGATKYYLLKVDPKKKMIFNPEESIEFIGHTGPFVQYTYARIQSILRKNNVDLTSNKTGLTTDIILAPLEKKLLIILEQYSTILQLACNNHNPSEVANYVFSVAKTYNSFYAEHSVTNAETPATKELRLLLSCFTANVIKSCMTLLGITVPNQM